MSPFAIFALGLFLFVLNVGIGIARGLSWWTVLGASAGAFTMGQGMEIDGKS